MRRSRSFRVVRARRVPDDLAALLGAERDRTEVVPADVEERLWQRVGATVGLLPPGGGGDGGVGGPDDGAGVDVDGGGSAGLDVGASPGEALGASTTASTTATSAAASATGAATSAGATAWLATATGKLLVSASLVVAGVGGVTAWRAPPAHAPEAPATRTGAPPAHVATSQREAPARAGGAGDADDAGPSQEPQAAPTPSAVASTVAPWSSSPPQRDLGLAAERELLERARAALARGDAAVALEALARHAERHPRGRLGDEREALTVRALVAVGRRDEARARFERFRARSPDSLLVPAMEAIVGGT